MVPHKIRETTLQYRLDFEWHNSPYQDCREFKKIISTRQIEKWQTHARLNQLFSFYNSISGDGIRDIYEDWKYGRPAEDND